MLGLWGLGFRVLGVEVLGFRVRVGVEDFGVLGLGNQAQRAPTQRPWIA